MPNIKRAREADLDAETKRVKAKEGDKSNGTSSNQSSNQSSNEPVQIATKTEPVSEVDSDDDNNDNNSIDADDNKNRHDSLRKQQHQKSDKQRRAKIKEGMDQLKTLVSMHGKLESPDQASIVAASIELVHSLRSEIIGLKGQIDAAHTHNAQQRLAIQQFQSRLSTSMYNQPPYANQMIPPNNFNDSLEATVIQRSNSLLNNGQNVSNAQFAQLASQIQQLRSFANTHSHPSSSPPQQQQQQQQQSNNQSNNQPNNMPQSMLPLSTAQMAQITALLQHSQMSPSTDLNALLSSVVPNLTQSSQFMRGTSQTSPQPPQSQQSQQQQQMSGWD